MNKEKMQLVSTGLRGSIQASELHVVAALMSIINGGVEPKAIDASMSMEDGETDFDAIIEKYSQGKEEGVKIIYLGNPRLSRLVCAAIDACVTVPELLVMKHDILQNNPVALELVHFHQGSTIDRNPNAIVSLSHAPKMLAREQVSMLVNRTLSVDKVIKGKIEEWTKNESLSIATVQVDDDVFKKEKAIACIVISSEDRKKFSMQNLLKNLKDEDGNPCAFLAVVVKDQPAGKEKTVELVFAPWINDMKKEVKDVFAADGEFKFGGEVGVRNNPTFITTGEIVPSEVLNLIEKAFDHVMDSDYSEVTDVMEEEVESNTK